MKKFILLVILAFTISVAAVGKGNANREYNYGKRGYFGTARASYSLADCSPYRPGSGFAADIINGYSFNHWFSLGAGIGIITTAEQEGNNIRIPVYIHLRANVLDRKVTPFFAVNLGGGICKGFLPNIINGSPAEENGHYGFYSFEPQAGVAVRFKNGKMIDFGVSAFADFGRGINVCGKFGVGFTW